jgi:hypothetical protein
MSFLDVGGGGGDSGGGGKGGGAGDGGGGGGSAANPLGDSPDLTGLGGPGGGGGGLPSFDMGMGGQQNITTPSPSDPSNDPNVGAPQSQNPTPGQSPTSIGGTQSGGGSPLEQLLKGVRAQASPLEAAAVQGQGYGGGQAGTSTGLQETIPPGTATELQQQQAGGAQRFAPGRPDLSTEPTFAQQPDVHQQQTAGQAQRFAPSGARPDIEAQQIAAGQAARYPSAGAQETAQRIAEGQQAGTAGQAQRYPPEGPPPAAQPPRDPNVPAAEAPKTGDTSTAATTAAPPASTGPVSSRGQGPAAQGANPMQIIGDLLRGVLTGDFSGLSRDLQGLARQPGAQPGPGGYGPPSTGGQPPATAPATAPAAPPAVGSQAMNSRPGAPDGPSPATDDAQGQRRQEWYQTHDRATPFPEDQFPEQQGPTKEGGVLPDYTGRPQTGAGNYATPEQAQRAAAAANDRNTAVQQTKQIAAMPRNTHANNFNQPLSSSLAQDRARYKQLIAANPQLHEKILRILYNEQSTNPQGTQAIAESMLNRASVRGHSLEQVSRWTSARGRRGAEPGGYYDIGGGYGGYPASARPVLEQSLQNALNGSNISNYATDNSSSGLAVRDQLPQYKRMFQYQSNYTGETFFSPARMAEPVFTRNWNSWSQRMIQGDRGGAPPAAQAPPPPPRPDRSSGLDLLQMTG